MKNKFAIAQIHTTGPNMDRDSIIQLGVLPLDGSGAPQVQRFHTETKLSRSAKERSGLNDSMIENAPLFGSEASAWSNRIKNFTHIFVLKTGSGNECEWIKRVILENQSGIKIIDLRKIIQFFFPGINDFSLEGLYSEFYSKGLKSSAAILEKTLLLAETMLKSTMKLLSRSDTTFHTHFIDFIAKIPQSDELLSIVKLFEAGKSSGWLIDELLVQSRKPKQVLGDLAVNGKDLTKSNGSTKPYEITGETEFNSEVTEVSPVVSGSLFRSNFIKESLKNYVVREEQVQYARRIASVLMEQKHHYLEAPTGIGKTLGYLIPAALYLERNSTHKIVIATSTKNLQAQIQDKDWPLIERRFPNIKIATLKGKSNYICHRALARQYSHYMGAGSTWQEKAAWIYMVLFSHETEGDLERIPYGIKHWLKPIFNLIQDIRADKHCTKSLCVPEECVYGKHLLNAKAAQIIITNHHKAALLSPDILDCSRALIIDEAEKFGDNVRQALSITIKSGDIRRLLNRINGTFKRKGFLQIIKGVLKKLSRGTGTNKKSAGYALEKIEDLKANLSLFEENLKEFINQIHPRKMKIPPLMSLLPIFENEHSSIKALLDPVISPLKAANQTLQDLQTDDFPLYKQYKEKCESYRVLISEVESTFEEIIDDFSSKKYAHQYNGNLSKWVITKKPVYIREILSESLYSRVNHIVFTSATLILEGRPKNFIEEYGSELINLPINHTVLPSPFPFRDNVFCAVDTSITPYNFRDKEKRMQNYKDVNKAILTYVLAANGRTLVLFMSRADMQNSFKKTSEFFGGHDILPILQNGSSLEEIREFQRNEYSVLFGVDRFWSGVDFPGSTLSQVIIVKAPNPGLDDPLIAHRRIYENDFMYTKYGIYGALKLRQGFGRLVRSMKDRGGVIILDSRYEGNLNFQSHIHDLPVSVMFSSNQEKIMREMLKSARLKTEFQNRQIDPFLAVRDYNLTFNKEIGGIA